MHLAEGMLPMEQAALFSAAAIPALAWSVRGEQVARSREGSSPVLMAGVTSLLFAATLLPLPVPIAGATSHVCLTPVLALVVGVRRVLWPTFFVLLLQAVFFAHGGLTTLGVNTLTLGLAGPAVTVGLWSLMRRLGATHALGLGLACGLGSLSVYVADALVLALALSDLAEPLATFTGVLLGFSPVQIPLAVLEGFASVGIVQALASRRPSLLPEPLRLLRKSPAPISSVGLLLIVATLSGCDYEGIDGSVFGAAAEHAGRVPTDSLLDLSQGELGLAMTIIILFGLGFISGRSWERLGREDSDALPR